MQKIAYLVHKFLLYAQKAQKRQADSYCRDLEYTMVQKVLLSMSNLRFKLLRKLQDRYMGTFEVLKRVGPCAYKLDLSYSSTLKMMYPVFYISLLRDSEHNGLRQQPPLVEADGQQKYQIEAIVGHRTYKAQTQYYYHLWVMMLLRMSGWQRNSYPMPKSFCLSIY